ncbi:MAG: PIG-L deacetylase family protein [Candidatus Bathyarchaeia archaeon]|jgi:LmbE family N-acetylglucosaminyl deacetylase
MVFRSNVLLAIGAHPDDVELGCAGTIHGASIAGAKVVVVYLTKGEKSGDPKTRVNESKQALNNLGVKDVFFGDFPDTEIPNSYEVISFLEAFYEKYKPATILTHTIHDTHQDHRQVGWLSFSAFRNAYRLLAYETPRATGEFNPAYFVDIHHHVGCKWTALKCHVSQIKKRYIAYESMVNLSSFRGSQVNLAAAEAFEVLRYVETAPAPKANHRYTVKSQ